MRRVLFLLLAALPAVMPAEESKTPATEVEMEAAHNGSYGYMGAAVELEHPKLEVGVQGYRSVEEGRVRHIGLLGLARPIDLANKHLTVSPGASMVVSDRGERGVAATLGIAARYKRLSMDCYLVRDYALGGDRHGFFWIYPLAVEARISTHWGVAGVLETSYSGKKAFNEYGPRLVRHDRHGYWFAGWMTSVSPEEEGEKVLYRREHIARFGRVFRFGGSQED